MARLSGHRKRGVWTIVIVLTGVSLIAAAAGCTSTDNSAESTVPRVDFSEVSDILAGACSGCHAPSDIGLLLSDTDALDNELFTEAAFPDSNYGAGLANLSVEDLIENGNPVGDASMDEGIAQRKAWILHLLRELQVKLTADVPPDFTAKETFDAYAVRGEPGDYKGCLIIAKLNLGQKDNAHGMPPLWTDKLMELLNRKVAPVLPEDHKALKNYTQGLLPKGGGEPCT